MHYCTKKEGDVEEDYAFIKINDQRNVHVGLQHNELGEDTDLNLVEESVNDDEDDNTSEQDDYGDMRKILKFTDSAFIPLKRIASNSKALDIIPTPKPRSKTVDWFNKLFKGNQKFIKTLISYFTMTETIIFENLNKGVFRKQYHKLIIKHQRTLIINTVSPSNIFIHYRV